MATITAAATGNFNTGGTWNGGVVPGVNDIADPNGQVVTLDTNNGAISNAGWAIGAAGGSFKVPNSSSVTVAIGASGFLSSSASAGITWGTGTCALTINYSGGGGRTYSGTSASGMISLAANQTLTENSGTVANSSSGTATVTTAASSAWTVSNAGGNASNCTGTGRIVNNGGGTVTLTGANLNSGAGISIAAGAGTTNVDVVSASHTTSSACIGVRSSGGTLNVSGMPLSTGLATAVQGTGGTINWTGTLTHSAGNYAFVDIQSGTLNMGTSGTALAITNSGNLVIRSAGTVVQTYSTITKHTSDSTAAGLGFALTITGPALPPVGDVISGANDYGYAASLLTPTATLPAGSNVWHTAAAYGRASAQITPTKTASTITNCSSGNIKFNVTIDDVTGSYSGGSTTGSMTGTYTGSGGGPVVGCRFIRGNRT